MLQLVKYLFETGKALSTIPHSGWVLASVRFLPGKTVTMFVGVRDDCADAHWAGREFTPMGGGIPVVGEEVCHAGSRRITQHIT